MSIDGREFRDALGFFATGVCVITANPEGHEPFGMTVNSFASVSLDPPLILWSLQNNSEMYEAWVKSRKFAVNILRQDQQPLASRYARKGDHSLEAADYTLGATGLPVLPNSLVSLECELSATHPGGDHLIIVGHVLEMENRENGEPLLFCAGGYRELA
jgi:flavin reductase (DIM6/NTAB) family NADH-FMN oxidoreductase RutF